MCKVKMFGTWLRVDTSASYVKLARALVAVGNRTIAEAVCTTRGMEVTLVACVHVYYSVHCVVGTRGGSIYRSYSRLGLSVVLYIYQTLTECSL